MNVLLRFAGLVSVLLLGTLPALADGPVAPPLAIGAPAPGFSLETIDGKRVSLEDFRGKTLVVNAWATWCPPCRQETPDMLAAYKQLHASDVVFLGIDSSEDPSLVRTFVATKGIGWQQALDTDRKFSSAYGIQFIPTTFVIDPKGIVRARFIDLITPRRRRSYARSSPRLRPGATSSSPRPCSRRSTRCSIPLT